MGISYGLFEYSSWTSSCLLRRYQMPKRRRPPTTQKAPFPFDSLEEGHAVCTLANLCGLGAQEVLQGLDLAHARGRWDWVYIFPTCTLFYDYDGGYFHNAGRTARDRTKSLDAVNRNPDVVVVRVRVGAAAALDLQHDRIHVLHDRSADTTHMMVARRIMELLEIPVSPRSQDGDGLLHDVMLSANREYRRDFQRLVGIGGEPWAQRMLLVHGARFRLAAYVDGLTRLHLEWQLTPHQLGTFVSGGVAALIDNERFWEGLECLRIKWQMDTKQLCAFMCNGVASKIDSACLWAGLETLHTEWQMTTTQLCKFMCNGVASKIDNRCFWAGLGTLRTEWQMNTNQLCTFMCNGVASKIDNRCFWAGLETLRTEWQMNTNQLCAFMCGGVASKIDSEYFWTGLETLRTECQMDTNQLCAFMCGGVASKIDSEYFWTGLETLRTEWQMDTEQLCAFMCNGVAAKIDNVCFWAGLRRLKDGIGRETAMWLIRHGSFVRHLVTDRFVSAVVGIVTLIRARGHKVPIIFFRPPYVCRTDTVCAIQSALLRAPDISLFIASCRLPTYRAKTRRVMALLDPPPL